VLGAIGAIAGIVQVYIMWEERTRRREAEERGMSATRTDAIPLHAIPYSYGR
jgi:hypothetical protein